MRNKLVIVALAILSLGLGSCKQTYYEYDLKNICEACEENGGVNRFHTDVTDIVVVCKDGEVVRLK